MAVDTSTGMWLLGAMDSLWFHQIILLSQPPETSETKPLSPFETPDTSSRNSSLMSEIAQQETCQVASDETISQESENDEEETSRREEKQTRLYLASSKTRYHSSSPTSARNQSRMLRYTSYYTRKLPKTRSCKTLTELELEEVEGFMDLGFTFPKEKFNSRLMKLLPGLQKIGAYNEIDSENSPKKFEFTKNTHSSNDSDAEKIEITRPYLAEAWFAERRESPLMRLRTPRSATASAADMKKQLKDWARTVASIIRQDP